VSESANRSQEFKTKR